ncbi:flagellar hook protein, partial [Candidatus Poribacteria bacterium]
VSNTDILTATASSEAAPGLYSIEVVQLAAAEQLSSNPFSDTTSPLGISGEMLINGVRVEIDADDSLADIRDKINNASAGVTAAIISVSSSDHRLVITSNQTGSQGISLAEVYGNPLYQLGFIDGTLSIKHPLGEGAESDQFNDMTSPIATLLNLRNAPSGNVTIGDATVFIDLSTDSLQDIKQKIEAAAPTGVTVSLVEETTSSGTTLYKLRITGTTNFVDDGNVLQVLGILEGNRSAVSQTLTSSVANTTDGTTPITESTTFSEIYGANVSAGDTITITGTDHDGNQISATFTISDPTTTTIRDFLDAIESAFGGTVTATVDSQGRIVVTDNTPGDSKLSLTLIENNEGGGSLDFGEMQVTTVGRERELQAGQDAVVRINGIEITRSSNTIDDALQGITLNLQKAEPGTTVTMNVSLDVNAIKGMIQDFVNAYNDLISYINDQFTYDPEAEEGGTLMGDVSLLTVQSRLRSILINEVSGLDQDLNALVKIGIKSDTSGLLSIDDSKLDQALRENLDQVINLFTVTASTVGDIEYISHTEKTKAGTYTVLITQAPERATVAGSTPISSSGIAQDETLTITDLATGVSETVQLYAGDTIDTIVDRINSLLHRRVAQVLTADKANTAGGAPITGDTTFAEIDGANVSAGDTITITGTDHNGDQISATFTISDPNTTRVVDLLTAIENAFGGQVTATIDSSGRLVVTDNTTGTSQLSLTLIENNEGGGSLDFGNLVVTTQGRYEIPITAYNDNGVLRLTHDYYGSKYGLSVVSDVEDSGDGSSTGIGTTTLTDYGVDVAGTINGEPATGDGQYLTGSDSNEYTAGLRIKVNVTPETLSANGGTYEATIALSFGLGEQMERVLDYMTESDGLVARRQEALQDQIEEIDERIEQIERRVEMERERLERIFTELERALNEITAQGNYLLTQLAALTGNTSGSGGFRT